MMMFDPLAMDLGALLQGPSWGHFLGTDGLGRDMLARALSASLTSLTVALGVWGVAAALGIAFGMLAGWFGGIVGRVFDMVCDMVLALPGLLVALLLSALLTPGVGTLIVVLGGLGWVGMARLVRAQVLTLRGMPYVLSAQIAGVRWPGVMARHLWPGVRGVVAVESLFILAGAMVAEAALSFLGLGIPAPAPSLGGMIRDGMRTMLVAPHAVVVPAVVLICLTLGLNMFAHRLKNLGFSPK